MGEGDAGGGDWQADASLVTHPGGCGGGAAEDGGSRVRRGDSLQGWLRK